MLLSRVIENEHAKSSFERGNYFNVLLKRAHLWVLLFLANYILFSRFADIHSFFCSLVLTTRKVIILWRGINDEKGPVALSDSQ